MTHPSLIRSLGLIVIAAAAVVLLTRGVRIPSIVAYILAGLSLGPIAGLLEVSEGIHIISEVGIALLLFLVGLELSLERIRDVGRVAVITGVAQVAGTAGLGFGLGRLLGFAVTPALLLALAMTFSSTVVVVKLLDQRKELQALHGRVAVGVLLIQDLVVIVVLTFLAGLGQERDIGWDTLLRGMGTAFGGMVVLLATALLASRFLLPRLFRWVAPAADAMFVWSLFWCFLLVIFADELGLSPEVGAFVAGVGLAQLPYSHALQRRVHPLTNFFVAIFFVALGMEMELAAAAVYWRAAVVLTAFVVLVKCALVLAALARQGYSERTAFLAGISLAQVSEFSFILMALAAAGGLADEALLALVAVVGLASIAISSYMILFGERLYRAARRLGVLRPFRARASDEEVAESGLRGHIIVVGMNSLGRILVERLVERGEAVLAVDSDAGKLRDLACPTLVGNAEDVAVLEEAGLERARLLVSTLQIVDTNQLLAYRAREYGVPSSIHAFDPSLVADLRTIGVSHLMLSKHQGIRRLARELQVAGILDG